jgi:hypothetical protein
MFEHLECVNVDVVDFNFREIYARRQTVQCSVSIRQDIPTKSRISEWMQHTNNGRLYGLGHYPLVLSMSSDAVMCQVLLMDYKRRISSRPFFSASILYFSEAFDSFIYGFIPVALPVYERLCALYPRSCFSQSSSSIMSSAQQRNYLVSLPSFDPFQCV